MQRLRLRPNQHRHQNHHHYQTAKYLKFILFSFCLSVPTTICAFVPLYQQSKAAGCCVHSSVPSTTTTTSRHVPNALLVYGSRQRPPLHMSSSASSSSSSRILSSSSSTVAAAAAVGTSSAATTPIIATTTTTTPRAQFGGGSSSSIGLSMRSKQGLSRYHQSILSRMAQDRQRFVSGKYPVICQVLETPTLKWLAGRGGGGQQQQLSPGGGRGRVATATSQLMINGTSVERSVASYDRFQWLDDEEREELHQKYALVSWELLAVISISKPGYVNILPGYGPGSTCASSRFLEQTSKWERWKFGSSISSGSTSSSSSGSILEQLEERVCHRDRLWVTGFSLTGRNGLLKSIDTDTGHIESVNSRTAKSLLWPNEVSPVPSQLLLSSVYNNNNNNSPPYPMMKNKNRNGELHNNDSSINSKTSSSRISSADHCNCAVGDSPVPVVPQTTTMTPPLPMNDLKDALLVSDGFLVPGKDRGGIYVVNQPGNTNSEWTVCLTTDHNNNQQRHHHNDDRWFYHRAVWVDLTGDGRRSILTARAKFPLGSNNDHGNGNSHHKGGGAPSTKPERGQLVCLEMPKPFRIDEATGTPLERDGTIFDPLSSRHLPWKVHVLSEGPDVMFNVVDMDTSDDAIEVISSQFFGEKVKLHSIQRGPMPRVTFQRTIDDKCGKAFGCIVADLEEEQEGAASNNSVNRCVLDSGSTVKTLKEGDAFSHLLVSSHECSFREENSRRDFPGSNLLKREHDIDPAIASTTTTHRYNGSTRSAIDGGSLFAYRVPKGEGKWKTDEWLRTTMATGFKVHGQLNNMINPGAPGFVYTFHARQQDKQGPNRRRPLIAVAGDCAESAYIFRPSDSSVSSSKGEAYHGEQDVCANYDLMCEIKCGATVGSIGVGYGDFCETEQESGYAKLYIPCYEDDKILVFGLGGGEED